MRIIQITWLNLDIDYLLYTHKSTESVAPTATGLVILGPRHSKENIYHNMY